MYPSRHIVLVLTWSLVLRGPPITFGTRTQKLAHQPLNVLENFFSYEDISVMHFDVPENAVSIGFTFIAREMKTGGIGECRPRDVTINIKSGSLPLVRPDGSKIEAKLMQRRRGHYTVEALSDGEEHYVEIGAPPPGDWYAIAYRSWFDPHNEKIQQQGLGATCETMLDAELQVEFADSFFRVGELTTERTIEMTSLADSSIVQFYVPKNTERSTLRVTSSCGQECSVVVQVIASDQLVGKIFNTTEFVAEFRPHEDAIHYVILRLFSGDMSNVTVTLDNNITEGNLTEMRLMRKSLPDFFLFDFDHTVGNSTKPVPMNLSADSLSILKFKVGSVYDTGGTLSIGLKIAENKDNFKDRAVIVGCISLGYPKMISEMGRCVYQDSTYMADILVTNHSTPAIVHVPYPEPGIWYLSLRAYCPDSDECSCFDKCTSNASGCGECKCAHECDSRVESSIGSWPCIEGKCSSHGQCVNHPEGGFIFSVCLCTGGYRGFDCADNRYILSRTDAMVKLFMLTLSNLAFVGSIYVAIKRHYFTESLVYAAVMFFSTFYHACEAEEKGHRFCLMELDVLQFCDFYNALLSIWVTLVAMASMGPRTTSFCHMLGVIVLAVGATMDRTALWVFLLPAVSGCVLVLVSWAFKCRQKGSLRYPARVYRVLWLPLGLSLVVVGLVCYAFLQTRRNYYIVHSVWHVCVAAGVVLLLPRREYMQ